MAHDSTKEHKTQLIANNHVKGSTTPSVRSRICSASVSSTLASLNFCWSLPVRTHTRAYNCNKDSHYRYIDICMYIISCPCTKYSFFQLASHTYAHTYIYTGRPTQECSAWSQRQDARARMLSQGPLTPACKAGPQPRSAPGDMRRGATWREVISNTYQHFSTHHLGGKSQDTMPREYHAEK